MDMKLKGYKIAGLMFNDRIIFDDIEACQDLLTLRWSRVELYSDVRGGVLPVGTLIQSPDGRYHMVKLSGSRYDLVRMIISITKEQENNEPITN